MLCETCYVKHVIQSRGGTAKIDRELRAGGRENGRDMGFRRGEERRDVGERRGANHQDLGQSIVGEIEDGLAYGE